MGRGLRACFVALLLLLPLWFPFDVNPFRSSLFAADRTIAAPASSGIDSASELNRLQTIGRMQTVARLRAANRIRAAIAVLCGGDSATIDGDRLAADGSYRSVIVPYCAVLRRMPDSDGLAYWEGQLASGLTPVQMVDQLIASAEYQARGVQPFRSTLANLILSPDRQEERLARAAAAEAARQEAERLAAEAEAARQAELISQAEAAKRAARLRIRNEISVAEFDAWIGARNIGVVDAVMPALIHMNRTGDGQRINVAYVHLSATRGVAVSPGDRGRSAVGNYAAEIGAHVAINGNWYLPYDGPAVSGGEVYGGDDHGYTALFGFTADGDAIIDHHREINDSVDDRVVEGVSGHPTLVFRGETTTDFGNDPTFTARNPRTAIGLDQSGDILIMVTVDGRSSTAAGMTGAETAVLMAELGAYDAVMLDGGGSTTMWIADRGVVNRPSGSLRAVGNQIVAYGN